MKSEYITFYSIFGLVLYFIYKSSTDKTVKQNYAQAVTAGVRG